MSWRTSSPARAIRRAGRSLGLNRPLARLLGGGAYEHHYNSALAALVRAGDTVWDVGANVGLYTMQFASLVGPAGTVVAWEPSVVNVARLRRAVAAVSNVTVRPVGLGRASGSLRFKQGGDPTGATSRIVDGETETGDLATAIDVVSGDEMVEAGTVPAPSVVKIDTEGYELDTLIGMRRTITRPTLRAIGIEVHFGILEQRGLSEAPSEIEALLDSAGFTARWTDSSHIVATRSS